MVLYASRKIRSAKSNFKCWASSVNDTFIQVAINTRDKQLCFHNSSIFYIDCIDDKNLVICIESFKSKIVHVFACFKFTDENEGCWHSVHDNDKGWVFLVADSEDEMPKEFSKRYFMFGDQFDNKDQMIWSLAPTDILIKSKTISMV